ncbi:MAG: HAD-IB family phosphatase [Syntrophomonadaceae bacterium]|jgi:HAD superfamily hydrolase (TIGR01490 family)|nr:HAD-IB family phosphatase [Syntrophomonadaceae bacterium]
MKLAIFDFDGTLFLKDTLFFLAEEWLRQGKSRLKYISIYLSIMPVFIMYKLGLVSRAHMKYQAMTKFQRIFAGLSQSQIGDFFQQTKPHLSRYYNPQVLAEIKKAQAQRFHLVLLSGAYSMLLEQVAQDLKLDTVIGAELYFKDGTIDYRREISFVDGINKLNLLQEVFAEQEVDWLASRSYGDSFDDLLALEVAGERVAVNPETRLLDYARDNDWRVLA